VPSEEQWAAITATPERQRWRRHMADLMPHHDDASPVAEVLSEIFHLD
jgi:L-rhamnose mutarotase